VTLLHAADLRATASRLAVLDMLSERQDPQSHADLLAVLGARGFDRETVYRNLVDLVSAGLARRADLGVHVWRREVAVQAKGRCDGCS
jgi:Fur family ferric uptake transcriptional regulator